MKQSKVHVVKNCNDSAQPFKAKVRSKFKQLGAGVGGTVFELNVNAVLKVFDSTDTAYADYLTDVILPNQTSPCFPKVLGCPVLFNSKTHAAYGRKFYALKLEKLRPLLKAKDGPNCDAWGGSQRFRGVALYDLLKGMEHYVKGYFDKDDGVGSSPFYDDEKEALRVLKPEEQQALDKLKAFKERTGYFADLHGFNVMVRGKYKARTLVFTDPFFAGWDTIRKNPDSPQ